MPQKEDKIALETPFFKRSSKLLPCQKEMMHYWYGRGISIGRIAKLFHCNKRTVQFELFPERHKRNYALRVEKGGSTFYYKKEVHTKAIASLREFKKQLFKNNNK
ncbi:MAG: hypothetical protein NVS1B13_24680 [Flavisolibacter sp.]